MALLAHDPQDRAEQVLALTERLAAMIGDETRRIEQREASGGTAQELERFANAYRLELARIKDNPALIAAAPAALLAKLRRQTEQLGEKLAAHEVKLGALKAVTEGLVHAMAEEVTRQRSGAPSYGAGGVARAAAGPRPALVDRSA